MEPALNTSSSSRARAELDLPRALQARGVSRRDFIKFCGAMAGILALPASETQRIAAQLEATTRPAAIFVEFQDCAGCAEALLRSPYPSISEIVLDLLSLNYIDVIMAAAGDAAEAAKEATMAAGEYILMVEGAIPLAEGGIYAVRRGQTAIQQLEQVAEGASFVIAVGDCASFGNIPAAYPNPTGAVGVSELLSGLPIVNMAGCPPNAHNLAALITHVLTFNSLPALDRNLRPLFAHSDRIHDHCPRRAHFDAGQFVEAWGDRGALLGWCLYKMGCKGPQTYYNCPTIEYNLDTSWPIKAGHPCIGCAEPAFWDTMTPFYRRLPEVAVRGTTVESDVDTLGLILTGATAVGIAAHAFGSMIRKRETGATQDTAAPIAAEPGARLSPPEGTPIEEPPPPPPPLIDEDRE